MYGETPKTDIQKLIEERQEPLKNIASFYEEQRKAEAEARAKAEAEELAKLPPKPLTPEERQEKQLAELTKAVAELTNKLKGDAE
ncbi:hypothetical protein P2R12_23265 [Cytobacillus oceanisediminis]|uniref:hypothetical protein n=1 Tax=Cytobacillus oceanisediminis TaxID=665099 RepID=UPI0023DB7048|nr:hypothetical protein [Cytobacillus oceanisediminis]MDF2039865.1 hypothetical protein [Cytobacillus oceanisediminis]